jgi:hypothetical protein
MDLFQSLIAAPDALERWKKQGAAWYLVLTAVAAWTVVVSTATARRPSALIAELAGGVGLAPLERWLTADAPPLLATSSSSVRTAMLLAVLVVMIVLGARVLTLGRRGRIEVEAGVVMSSRAAATPWLLLLIAAQQQPLSAPVAVLPIAGSAAVVVAACWLILRTLSRRIAPWLSGVADGFGSAVRRALTALLVLPAGMVLSLMAPIVLLGGWLFQTEPDRLREMERKHARRVPQPSGSIAAPHRL